MRQAVLIDGRNQYDPELAARFDFEYAGVGRPASIRSRATAALAA